ncbi:MAG TPA: hypothetical protein PLM62_04480 [Zoogloea sp.]|nr:hypothetical protein [Zoogloea sp.]
MSEAPETKTSGKTFTREDVQAEIVERIYLFGIFMAMFLEPRTAVPLYDHPDFAERVREAPSATSFHEVEEEPTHPERFSIWHEAGIVYDFAFGALWDLQGSYSNPLRGMLDFIARLKTFEETTNACVLYNEHATVLEGLTLVRQVIERANARMTWAVYNLTGEPSTMTIRDFALVADLSDRTIRNLLSLDEKAAEADKSGLVVRKEGAKTLIDLEASLGWIQERKEFIVYLYDSLYDALPTLRQIVEVERQREGLEVAAFAERYDLPLPALENLLNGTIPPNPILLDCAQHIAKSITEADESLRDDPAYQETYREALTRVLMRSPVPMCAWSEHKDRDQWEETGELLDRLGVFFRSREAILGDHPKLKWLLGWSHYLR